jgi:hypothetical protein
MTDAVAIAIASAISGSIAAVPGIIAAIRSHDAVRLARENNGKIDTISVEVDGKMTELLELTRKASHAEGIKEEKERNSK